MCDPIHRDGRHVAGQAHHVHWRKSSNVSAVTQFTISVSLPSISPRRRWTARKRDTIRRDGGHAAGQANHIYRDMSAYRSVT